MFEKISDNLYLFRDTCNVFVVKDGNKALLIDFGSGRVLDHLADLGIGQVDWILHTHHHRDQCQGAPLANERNIPIAVPSHELPYFEEVEVFWGSRQIYDIYDVRQTFFTLAQSVRTAQVLEDYETFQWGPYNFFVQPTPGHTLGHIALIAEIDGTRIAFSGDLIYAPGKTQTLYDLQYSYGASDGSDYMVYSLAKLRHRGCDLLCPSHGDPFGDTAAALQELENKFRAYLKHRWQLDTPTHDIAPRAILPHLIQLPGCSNTCRPTYMDFEFWVSAQISEVDRAKVDAFQTFMLNREHPEPKRTGIHQLTGCDRSINNGVLLNHLEDWHYAYDVTIVPHK